MAGEDFFKFNKGNEVRFSNFREIKEEDLKGADEKTKKLFNIFAGEDKILQEVEAKSLFNVLKSAAGDNQVLEDNEIKAFAKEHIGEEVDTNILATFVNNIFGTKEKPQNQAVQNILANAAQKQQTFLEEAACKEIVIDIIDENLSEAYEILNSQYLGSISGWHDERKDKNDILKTSNVSKVLDYQNAGIEWMNKAKLAPPNGLTKKEYYEGNKQRIKDMILTRVLVLDTNTKFKELKNKYSEEKLAEIIGDYVEQLCSNYSIEDLKDMQKQFVSYSGAEEVQVLGNIVDKAIKYNNKKNIKPPKDLPDQMCTMPAGTIPKYWNTDEPISFEEVYKIERGTEYSQYKIEQYALAKKEMEVVTNAYNKKQQFVEFAEGLRKDNTLNIDEKTQKVLEGFATFYALSEDGGLSQLQELIAESKLPISIDENGFNFGTLDDSAKNRALNSLLKLAQQSKEKEFEEFLNAKTIEDYQIALAQAHDEAIEDENGKMMAEAMKNDNLTCIQRWTGNTSMAGMGMTIVGGILCFTPLAPLGAGMITVGNTLAIGGMVAETGLGVADYATKDVQTAEEAEQLGKNFLMNAGGFIIGIGAGKAGMKAFSNLIDEKLVAVFGKQIAAGNKMQALKTVFTNPEYLKNFMTAAGVKLSADFVISYAGDLAMMGILDTQDDWQSLLKANLTGILVGMSGDIKDVSGVGRPRNFVPDGVMGVNEASRFDQPTSPHAKKPMTEMDYGQRLLGNDVTVANPKTGATVEGTVTGLYITNGQVEIEVNGQRYSTNDVAEVKGVAKVEVETPKIEISLGQRLETASSREDFVAIRDEIKAMPNGAEKTALQQDYLRKWNEFSRKYNDEFDIRMEYISEAEIQVTDLNMSLKYVKRYPKVDETLLSNICNAKFPQIGKASRGKISDSYKFYAKNHNGVFSKEENHYVVTDKLTGKVIRECILDSDNPQNNVDKFYSYSEDGKSTTSLTVGADGKIVSVEHILYDSVTDSTIKIEYNSSKNIKVTSAGKTEELSLAEFCKRSGLNLDYYDLIEHTKINTEKNNTNKLIEDISLKTTNMEKTNNIILTEKDRFTGVYTDYLFNKLDLSKYFQNDGIFKLEFNAHNEKGEVVRKVIKHDWFYNEEENVLEIREHITGELLMRTQSANAYLDLLAKMQTANKKGKISEKNLMIYLSETMPLEKLKVILHSLSFYESLPPDEQTSLFNLTTSYKIGSRKFMTYDVKKSDGTIEKTITAWGPRKKINELLDKCIIPEDIIVTRYEKDLGFFDSIPLNDNGMTIGDAIRSLEGKTPEEIQKYIADNLYLIHERKDPTSSSLNTSTHYFNRNNVKLNIKVPKGSKGIYLEDIRDQNKGAYESELLLKMKQAYKITNILFENGKIVIDLELIPKDIQTKK